MLWVRLGVLLLAVGSVRPARILALFPLNARSHFQMFSPLLKDLIGRGHHVTLLGHFPLQLSPDNYTFLDVSDSMVQMDNAATMAIISSLSWLEKLSIVMYENEDVCKLLGHPHSRALLYDQVKYDLIITELFATDCFLGFPYKLKIPFIVMTSSVMLPWGNDRFGNPDNPAYIPSYYLPYTDHMTLWQRTVNTVVTTAAKLVYRMMSERSSHETAKKYFGSDLPPLSEIARDTSLILVNSHFSANQPRPMVPGVVEVGGLHLPEPKALPQDLQEFIEGSDRGVIFFSLGSIFDTATLPEEQLRALLEVFANLPYRVLWKINGLEGLHPPTNCKTSNWLPQFDILNHPKTVLFITHGGLMGTQEAVYAGVPMLGIPLFADQHLNIAKYEQEGLALSMSFHDLSKDEVLHKVNTLLNNKSYTENARRLSRIFRDRPMSARETAVYWTEYVLRQEGASHLRSQGAVIPASQYLLLDVQEAIIAGGVVLAISCFTVLKYTIKMLMWVFMVSTHRGQRTLVDNKKTK